MNLSQLDAKIDKLLLDVAEKKGVLSRIEFQCDEVEKKISESVDESSGKKEAYYLTLAFISSRRDDAIESIEKTGTYTLRSIYSDDYKLHFMKNDDKKNAAAFKMEIGIESNFNDKTIITGLNGERGGGVVEAAAAGLRVAALEWLGYKGPLMLDETFKSISADEKIDRVAQWMRHYIDTSGRQVIFATHKADVFSEYSDHIVYVNKSNGISNVNYVNQE